MFLFFCCALTVRDTVARCSAHGWDEADLVLSAAHHAEAVGREEFFEGWRGGNGQRKVKELVVSCGNLSAVETDP